jgi:hypothetical protein
MAAVPKLPSKLHLVLGLRFRFPALAPLHAAASDREERFAKMRERFAEASNDVEAWYELQQQWHEAFADLIVEGPLLDGVLVVHLKNFYIQPYPVMPGSKVVDRILIEVYRRSGTPEDLERLYAHCLAQNNIPENDEWAAIGWRCYEGRLLLLVRPEDWNVQPLGGISIPPQGSQPIQRPFPSPKLLGSIYEDVLRALPEGVVTGRKGGPAPTPYNLVLACVAWYVGRRGEQVKQHAERPQLANLLNALLTRPCGLESLPESPENHAVWQRASNPIFTGYVMRVEEELNNRGPFLDKYL